MAGLFLVGKKLFPQTRLLEGLPKSPGSAPHPGKSFSSLAVTRGKGNSYSQVHHGLKHCLKSFENQPKHKYRMFPPLLPFKALCSYYLINLHSRFWKGRWFSSCHGDCKSRSRRRRRVSCDCPPIGASGRVLLCVDLYLLCLWVDVWGS